MRGAAVAAAVALVVLGDAPESYGQQPEGTDDGVTLAVIGDYGGYNWGAERVADLVQGWQPDAVVTVGDNLYSTPPGVEGTDMFDLTVGQYYCEFLGGAAPGPHCPTGGASTINRFFAATGNHDYTDAGIDHYLDYFDLPGPGTDSRHDSGSERYYDVVVGTVHLFVLDTDPALEDEDYLDEQRRWLQQGLEQSGERWQVVAMHHPPFSSGSDSGPTPQLQWPYALWGADLVLAGHEHSYERLQREGTTFVVNGLGGASRYDFNEVLSGGSAARYNSNEGAARIRATADQLEVEMVTVDGEVVDRHAIGHLREPRVVALQDGVHPNDAYVGTSDATLSEHEPDRPMGSLAFLAADGDDPPESGDHLAALLNWDLFPVPPGSEVLAASMTLHVTNPAEEQHYDVFTVDETWEEETVTWWSATEEAPWDLPGARADVDRPVGSVVAPDEGPTEVLLEPEAIRLIQRWADEQGSTPVGGLLVASSENSDGIEVRSSEAEDPSLRPQLEVVYRPPAGPWVRPEARQFAVGPEESLRVALEASGGSGPYTWAPGPGRTGHGVTVSADGTLSAESLAPGMHRVDVVVTDSTGRSSEPTTIRIVRGADEDHGAVRSSGGATRGLLSRYGLAAVVLLVVVAAAGVQRRRDPDEA